MKVEIEKSITYLACAIRGNNVKAGEAMQFAQAALNLCHILQGLNHIECYPPEK